MAGTYASVEDVAAVYRDLSAAEMSRCEVILPLLSDMIRSEYNAATGGDYDEYIETHPYLASTAKLVVCDVCFRFIRSDLTGDVYSQQQQGAIGYTWTGTYAVPGGGLANAFMERDWRRLKVHVPRIRSVQYDYDLRDYHNAAYT